MVISGGNFKPDTLKPKEVVSLLLDDEEIVTKCEYLLLFFWCLTAGFGCSKIIQVIIINEI